MADSLIATHGDSPERKLLFKALRAELSAHAAAEERFFYVPLMTHDLTQEPSRHGIAEHHEMDEMVETLEKTDYSSSAWLATAKDRGIQEGDCSVQSRPPGRPRRTARTNRRRAALERRLSGLRRRLP